MILTPEHIYCINYCSLETFKEYLDKHDTVNSIASIKVCLIVNEEIFQKIAYCNKKIKIISCNIWCNSKNCSKKGDRGESSKSGLDQPD